MQEEAAYVDSFRENVGTGVLGRMLDILQQKNFSVSALSIDNFGRILDGNSNLGRSVDVMRRDGVDEFYSVGSPSNTVTSKEMKTTFQLLNGDVTSNSGKYGDYWSHALIETIDKEEALKAVVDGVVLDHEELFANNKLGESLKMVTKLIKSQGLRNVSRDAFYVRFGGWDHHSRLQQTIQPKFTELNDALHAFKTEMTTLGLMDQVTLVMTSEFARVSANFHYVAMYHFPFYFNGQNFTSIML
jgi:uncharacterized protein (DUF1501 family)